MHKGFCTVHWQECTTFKIAISVSCMLMKGTSTVAVQSQEVIGRSMNFVCKSMPVCHEKSDRNKVESADLFILIFSGTFPPVVRDSQQWDSSPSCCAAFGPLDITLLCKFKVFKCFKSVQMFTSKNRVH